MIKVDRVGTHLRSMLCARDTLLPPTLLGYTAHGQKKLALLESLKVTYHQI